MGRKNGGNGRFRGNSGESASERFILRDASKAQEHKVALVAWLKELAPDHELLGSLAKIAAVNEWKSFASILSRAWLIAGGIAHISHFLIHSQLPLAKDVWRLYTRVEETGDSALGTDDSKKTREQPVPIRRDAFLNSDRGDADSEKESNYESVSEEAAASLRKRKLEQPSETKAASKTRTDVGGESSCAAATKEEEEGEEEEVETKEDPLDVFGGITAFRVPQAKGSSFRAPQAKGAAWALRKEKDRKQKQKTKNTGNPKK